MAKLPLGQLFLLGFEGHEIPDGAKELLAGEGAGGVILFTRNIQSLEQVVELNRRLFTLGTAEHPTLVSVDQEGGRVARLRGIMTDLPPMRRLGELSVDDEDLPYRVGAMMARELSALGFHLDFAPVVDVDTNPANPVIGDRSFGATSATVAHAATQLLRGMQQAGVAACAKHFPGHGDTSTDSHFELPVLAHDLERLERVELPPFQAAIEAGVASIMTAHVLFRVLDEALPATLSPAVLHSLLKERLGFGGVVISDDLEMKAVADRYEVEELVRLGLLAGIDLFLICHDEEKQARAIEAAHKLVESGEVPRSRAEDALARVARLKMQFLGAPSPPDLEEARAIVRSSPHLALAERLGRSDMGPPRHSPVDAL
ncbi:MAG: beta-N-acetylhexosaminidase [Myxococcota bacterium]